MKKEFLTGLTVILLAIGLVLAGCESPTNGSNGGSGTNALPADTATTAAGAEKFWAEGRDIVYFAGALTLGDGGEPSLTVPDGKTLILADVADLYNRAVAANGKGSITVKAGGTLNVGESNGTGTKLVVHNGSKVTVEAGAVALKGAPTVIVGTPGVIPAAADIPVFAIKGGTVTADGAAKLSFTEGAKLDVTESTALSGFATAKFAFEDPADLNETVVTAIKESGSTKLDVGGTVDATTGTVSGGTEVDPNGGASFPSTEAAFLTALSGSDKLVSFTGTGTVTITATTVNLTGRAVSLTKPDAELVIGNSVTVTVAGGAGVSMWAPFSGAGKITVSGTGILSQGDNYGIGGSRELVLTTTSKVTYNLGDSTLTVAGTGAEGAGTVTVTSSDGLNLTRNLTIAAGATLTLGSNHINLYAPVTLTVNGTLNAGNTTGTITLVPGSTLTVNGTVNALGSTNTAGAILLGGSPATGVYTVNGTGRIKLSASAVGPLFAVATNQTLAVTGTTLDGLSLHTDITGANPSPAIAEITGRAAALVAAGFAADAASNTFPLVTVTGSGAVLTLNAGAKVAGNTIATTSGHVKGAGVSVTTGGRLNIYGGEVSYNTIVAGGTTGIGTGAGVYADGGTITMSSGSISQNYIVANSTQDIADCAYGAGAAVVSEAGASSTFTFSGGTIANNFVGGSTLNDIEGAGVTVGYYLTIDNKPVNTFTMSGTAAITGNKVQYSGSVTGATARNYNVSGSAVSVSNKSDVFDMQGGTISGNSIIAATRYAYGAVYAYGTFKMSGGVIENNTATATDTAGTPTKGVMAVNPSTVYLSGSAKLRDGITLKPANSDQWVPANPKIDVGTLTADAVMPTINLQVRYTATDIYGVWPTNIILTGSGAVGAINMFTLGNFIKTPTEASTVTPIGEAGDTGYELTRDGETQNVKLTAKSG